MASIPFITAENAAELGRASQAAQRAKKELKLAEMLDPVAEQEAADKYRKLRLLRVRKQLDLIDEKIFQELSDNTDASKLDRLASAVLRVNEQERQLSNRSLPPTLKANQDKPRKPRDVAPEPE